MKQALQQRLFLLLGHLCLALGVVGLFLPVMPTVVFMIGAAWCYARGSPALRRRLLEHPKLGPPIRLWEQEHAITVRGKVAGITLVTLSVSVSILFLVNATWVRILLAAIGVAIVTFMLLVKTKR